MNPHRYFKESIDDPKRLSGLSTTLAWLFPILLVGHIGLEIANGQLVDWDPINGPYPLGSSMRFWEPNGIYSLFAFFNLLMLSVIFVYIRWTGIAAEPESREHRAKGFTIAFYGIAAMVASIVIAGISVLVSWLLFPAAAPAIVFLSGIAAIGWVQFLIGIAMMISGRDLLAESKRSTAK